MASVVASLMQFRARRNGFRWAAVPQSPLAVHLVSDQLRITEKYHPLARTLGYHDAESCRQAVSDALDVVDIVLAPFADKMAEALG
jgi:hypothetical protein